MRQDRIDHVGRSVEDVLTVVENQQPLSAFQCRGHALCHAEPVLLSYAEDGRDGLRYRRRVGNGGQLDNPHPVDKVVGQSRSDLECKTRLSYPTDPGQCHKLVCFDDLCQLGEFELPADEGGVTRPEVTWCGIDRLQWRELDAQTLGFDLENIDWFSDIA